jgi:hypothetical protein
MCTETCPRVASSIECDALATCPWRNGGCADRCELQYPNKNNASCTADTHCQINSLANARIPAASTSSRWLGWRILQARLRPLWQLRDVPRHTPTANGQLPLQPAVNLRATAACAPSGESRCTVRSPFFYGMTQPTTMYCDLSSSKATNPRAWPTLPASGPPR